PRAAPADGDGRLEPAGARCRDRGRRDVGAAPPRGLGVVWRAGRGHPRSVGVLGGTSVAEPGRRAACGTPPGAHLVPRPTAAPRARIGLGSRGGRPRDGGPAHSRTGAGGAQPRVTPAQRGAGAMSPTVRHDAPVDPDVVRGSGAGAASTYAIALLAVALAVVV